MAARASKLLFSLGCNLEDTAMTRLQGEFAMLLIFSAPEGARPDGLAGALKALEEDGVRVFLKPLEARERREPATTGVQRLVTVYGGDRPGIVSRVTEALAEGGFNVTDLATHRTEGPQAGYILYIEGEAPASVPDDKLVALLKAKTEGLGLTASVKTLDAEPL
jgi:glycine cleavage system transcriptional repressor